MDQWRHTGTLNAQVEEVFTGHVIVKSFGRQREVEARFGADNDELYKASFGAQFMSSLIQPAMLFMGNIQYILVAVVGGLRISSGAISVGDMQAMIQYSRQFSQPLTQLASMATMFQSGIASLERVLELLDADEQSAEQPPTVDPEPVRGRIVFDEVHFSYDPDNPLIEGLSVIAEPGETVAIVGRPERAKQRSSISSCGSTTSIQEQSVSTGRDIAGFPRDELRSNVGMVLQDTWLFGGTIRENIAYGNPQASEEQIREAARVTYVDRFVHHLPDGYDTIINDDGDNISAGERQLMTIARAFLADPAILILDEATSSVDTRTELLIQKAMNTLRGAAHELCDCPPTLHDPRCRHHFGNGGWADRRTGVACGAPRPPWCLLPPLQLTIRRGSPGTGLNAWLLQRGYRSVAIAARSREAGRGPPVHRRPVGRIPRPRLPWSTGGLRPAARTWRLRR